jgi:hypothetical protein
MKNGFTIHIYSELCANSDKPLLRERLLYHVDTSRTSETICGDKQIGLSMDDINVV